MKNKKNEGFTLVELLVSVVILGIITALVIPEVSKLIYSNKQTKFKSYEKSVVTGAKLYTDSYKLDMFGNNSSGCYDIKLKDIANKKMLEDIKVRDVSCIDSTGKGSSNSTYVRVYKSGDHYKYQVKFTCKGNKNEVLYETKNGLEENKSICDGKKIDLEPPKIEIIENNGISWHTGRNKKVKIKVSDEYGLLENTRIKYAWTKNPSSNPNFKTINARNKRYDPEAYFTIQVPQRENGLWYLLIDPVSVKDTNGNYTLDRITSNVFQLDNTPPVCTLSTTGTVGNNNWYISNANVNMSKSDAVGEIKEYGLTTSNAETYNNKAQQTQTETKGTSWYGYVKDKAGNTTKCSTSLKVDTTKPTCSLYISSGRKAPQDNTYYRPSTISFKSKSDGTSGIWQYGLDQSSNNSYNNTNDSNQSTPNTYTYYGHVKDNAGNENKCSFGVTIKIPYTCKSGETLDEQNGVCVFSSWDKTVSKTCTDPEGSCVRNVKVPCGSAWSWPCGTPEKPQTCWDGGGCYRTEYYTCTQYYDCSYKKRTCGNYTVYSGSGNDMKCSRPADQN